MKWILSIFLIILLSCVNILNGEDRPINEKLVKKMIEHMTKIRNLLRNLDEEDTGTSDEGSSEESSASEPSEESDESNESSESGSEPSESGSEPSESGSEPSESGSEPSE